MTFRRSPLPGGGPWLVLPESECPALLHNTQNAACKGPAASRCVCPRGASLRDEKKERLALHNGTAGMGSGVPFYEANIREGVAVPDLSKGACRSPVGQLTVDTYNAPRRVTGAAASHRRMCDGCPVRAACAAWVLRAEDPPGSWGGMYAGMDTTERRKMARRRRQERVA